VRGIDLTEVPGLEASPAQLIVAEIGTDLRKWPSEKHFASWLGLAPHNEISGGKVLRSKPLKVRNRAGQALRLAARTVGRTNTALGVFYRRMRARKGPKQAVPATAHKLARLLYLLLTERVPYRPPTPTAYEHRLRQRQLHRLKRQAQRLGFTLLPQPTAAL
jgi:transposase